jgi:hypothetical protein
VRCGDDSLRSRSPLLRLPSSRHPHSWDVNGEEAVVRIITVPGGFEDFMRESHEAEGDAWDAVAARYWIRMLPTA